jgi:hypothetical protein
MMDRQDGGAQVPELSLEILDTGHGGIPGRAERDEIAGSPTGYAEELSRLVDLCDLVKHRTSSGGARSASEARVVSKHRLSAIVDC